MPPHLLTFLFSLFLLNTIGAAFLALTWMLRQYVTDQPILPPWPEPPRIVPWGGLTVVAVVITWVVVNLLVSSAYLQVRSIFVIRSAEKPVVVPAHPAPQVKTPPAVPEEADKADSTFNFTEQMVLISLINSVLLVVLPTAILLSSSARWKDLGLTAENFQRNVLMGVVAFLVITPVIMAINLAAQFFLSPHQHPLERMLREHASPIVIVLAYVSAVVLAPAAEELIFRGVIQGWLRRVFTSTQPEPPPAVKDQEGPNEGADDLPADPSLAVELPGPDFDPTFVPNKASGVLLAKPSIPRRFMPILLTSVVFAAVHLEQMPAPLAIFPLSLTLGLLYERTESLVPTFVLHALFNGFNTTLLLGALLAKP